MHLHRITAHSKYGESKPVYLVQYTGQFVINEEVLKNVFRATVISTAHSGSSSESEYYWIDMGTSLQENSRCQMLYRLLDWKPRCILIRLGEGYCIRKEGTVELLIDTDNGLDQGCIPWSSIWLVLHVLCHGSLQRWTEISSFSCTLHQNW